MTPIEIKQLREQSVLLDVAFQKYKERLWTFLRQHVDSGYTIAPCVRCGFPNPLLSTPYTPGLCISCLLYEVLIAPPIEDIYRDPRSRYYDAGYSWGDFYAVSGDCDGPPIEMA